MISAALQERVDDLRLIGSQFKLPLSFEEIGEDLIMIQNQKNLKAGIVGLLEVNGSEVCVAYMMNMKKWSWAMQEGFETEDIISTDALKREIFKFTPLDELLAELD